MRQVSMDQTVQCNATNEYIPWKMHACFRYEIYMKFTWCCRYNKFIFPYKFKSLHWCVKFVNVIKKNTECITETFFLQKLNRKLFWYRIYRECIMYHLLSNFIKKHHVIFKDFLEPTCRIWRPNKKKINK